MVLVLLYRCCDRQGHTQPSRWSSPISWPILPCPRWGLGGSRHLGVLRDATPHRHRLGVCCAEALVAGRSNSEGRHFLWEHPASPLQHFLCPSWWSRDTEKPYFFYSVLMITTFIQKQAPPLLCICSLLFVLLNLTQLTSFLELVSTAFLKNHSNTMN